MRKGKLLGSVFPLLVLAPGAAFAQPQPVEPVQPPQVQPIDPQNRAAVIQELQSLRATRQEMQGRMSDFDARIQALEAALGVAPPSETATQVVTPQPGTTQPAETEQADAGD